jgi:hypothetical protein
MYGGLEIFNLETEQGVQHASLIVSHLWKEDEVGQMLHISLDHLQLQAGVSWPVMSQPGHSQRLYVDNCYLTHTWDFLDRANTHLAFEHPMTLLPQQQNDRFLMEEFARHPDTTPTELKHAQRCRLHLGVTTVADICESNGSDICGWAISGQRTRQPVLTFPRQDCPSRRVWQTWNTLLRRCFCHRTEGKLNTSMGPWYRGQVSQVWDTVIHPTTNLVYIWQNNKVRIYERHGRSSKQY